MLTATLIFSNGERALAELPPARAYPKLIVLKYGPVPALYAVRRGDSVGDDSNVYDVVEPVEAMRIAPIGEE